MPSVRRPATASCRDRIARRDPRHPGLPRAPLPRPTASARRAASARGRLRASAGVRRIGGPQLPAGGSGLAARAGSGGVRRALVAAATDALRATSPRLKSPPYGCPASFPRGIGRNSDYRTQKGALSFLRSVGDRRRSGAGREDRQHVPRAGVREDGHAEQGAAHPLRLHAPAGRVTASLTPEPRRVQPGDS